MLKELFDQAVCGPWHSCGLDVQYRIDGDTLILQGTVSAQDWRDNLDFPARPYRKMPQRWYAHRGLARKWKSARDFLIGTYGPAIRRVVGYSQGAALAILAHEDLGYTFGEEPETFAFAPPRVVWLSFGVSSRWTRCLSVIRRGDIVPMAPPALLGFRHVGTIKRIGGAALPWYTRHYMDEYRAALAGL